MWKALRLNDPDEVVRVLTVVIDHIAQPDTDVCWSGYDTPEEAIAELRELIDGIRVPSPARRTVRKISLLFLPTGAIQEIAISSGWGNTYLALAERMDHALGTD